MVEKIRSHFSRGETERNLQRWTRNLISRVRQAWAIEINEQKSQYLCHHRWAEMLGQLLSPMALDTPRLFRRSCNFVLSICEVVRREALDEKRGKAAPSKALDQAMSNWLY